MKKLEEVKCKILFVSKVKVIENAIKFYLLFIYHIFSYSGS